MQPLDEAHEPFAFALRRRKELLIRRRAARDVAAVQLQLQRRRGQLQMRQAFAQQQAQMGDVARRLGKRDVERAVGRRLRVVAVSRLVLHLQREAAHLGMLGRSPCHQPHQQQRRAVQHLLGGVGTREELEPAAERVG